MLDNLILGLVEGVFESTIGAWLAHHARVKKMQKWARAFDVGRDVAFTGWPEGKVPYGSRFGCGMLVLRARELFFVADLQLGPSFWHRIPTERLVVQNRAIVEIDPELDGWIAYECLDGETSVVLSCEPDADRYLRAALSLPELEDEPIVDARTDRPSEALESQQAAEPPQPD